MMVVVVVVGSMLMVGGRPAATSSMVLVHAAVSAMLRPVVSGGAPLGGRRCRRTAPRTRRGGKPFARR